MLPFMAPVLGAGWGCCVCKAPFDGAIAMVCDECHAGSVPLRFVCSGPISQKARAEIADFKAGPRHECDELYHPEIAERRIRKSIAEGRRP